MTFTQSAVYEFDAKIPMRVILFFREDMFYPTEYPIDYTDWQAEADRNIGTIKIETVEGEILWLKD